MKNVDVTIYVFTYYIFYTVQVDYDILLRYFFHRINMTKYKYICPIH